MIPNVNQITATLRGMPDQQLQQYAAMHKSDPYILALAVQESNDRKALRTASAAKMAGQQPSVADQDIAQMAQQPMPPQGQGMTVPSQGMPPGAAPQPQASQQLPEQQGIGALPVPNMQHMADGGIAGYAGDGDQGQLTRSSVPDGALIIGNMYQDPNTGKLMPLPDDSAVPFGQPASVLRQQAIDKAAMQAQSAAPDKAKLSSLHRTYDTAYFKPSEAAMAIGLGRYDPLSDPLSAPSAYPSQGSMGTSKVAAGPSAASTTPDYLKQPTPNFGGGVGVGKALVSPDDLKIQTANTLAQIQAKTDSAVSQITSQMKDDPDAGKSLNDVYNARKDLMQKVAPGVAMQSYEQKLKELEDAAPEQQKQAGLLALTKGFLAMAAGGSPYALQNVASGLGMAASDYEGVVKDFRKAAQERAKQFAEVDQLRRSEARGDVDASTKIYETIQDREANINAHRGAAVAGILNSGITAGAQVGDTLSRGLVGLSDADLQAKSHIAGAGITARAMLETERLRAQSNERIADVRGQYGLDRANIMAAAKQSGSWPQYLSIAQKQAQAQFMQTGVPVNNDMVEAMATRMMQQSGALKTPAAGTAPAAGAASSDGFGQLTIH
jgi:hypothetical protein